MISEIPVHNFGLVFHKKQLARKTGCCIVSSSMPLFFLQNKAFAKNRHGASPRHWNFPRKRLRAKFRRGAQFLTDTTNGTSS